MGWKSVYSSVFFSCKGIFVFDQKDDKKMVLTDGLKKYSLSFICSGKYSPPPYTISRVLFDFSIPFQKVDSTVIQCSYNISPCNSPKNWCYGSLVWLSRLRVLSHSFPPPLLAIFPPNVMKPPPPLTSISPLGWISKGTISRVMLNSQNSPCAVVKVF